MEPFVIHVRRVTLKAHSIDSARRVVREHIELMEQRGEGGASELGAEFTVKQGKKTIGHISYNGRFWPLTPKITKEEDDD
jgi:hypothetical protein